MLAVEKLFGDIFDSPLIPPDRLLLFAKDNLVRLTNGNTAHQFDIIIATITPLISVLETEVSAVDTTLNLQSGQTDEVDLVTYNFHNTLSILDGVIANSLGGKGTIAYKEFFPHGLTEYDKANRKTMVMLTTRINKAATKYATQLGVTVATQLQGFQGEYVTARSAQSTSIGSLSTNRGDRSVAVINMDKGLVQGIHTVGNLFPCDVVQCSGYFNFNLLFTVAHRKHTFYNEILAIDAQIDVVNRSFTDSITIIIRNMGTNADVIVWLALLPTDAPNAQAITVKAGKTSTELPSILGDLANTFLLIKNASGINPANCQIEIIG